MHGMPVSRGVWEASGLPHGAFVVARFILEIIHIVAKETVRYECIGRDIFLFAIWTLMIL